MRLSLHICIAVLSAVAFSSVAAATLPGKPNIVLITVDSFRPDRLGCYGYERAHTPNIDSLAARGVTFERAYSTASWTNPSMISLLTGLYPSVHGVERRGVSVPEALQTPLETMREAGYLVPEINYLFPMPNYLNLGFTPSGIRDLAEFLRTHSDTTFFAWYHYHGPHLPYNPPGEHLKKFIPEMDGFDGAVEEVRNNVLMPKGEQVFGPREREMVGALYDGEVSAQDEELEVVFRTLDSLNLTGNTIVVLTADHGEELFDHGWIGHGSTSLAGTLYEELVRIPLIVSWPGRLPPGQRVRGLVQVVDVMPTLFELIGLDPVGPMQGRSFLASLEGKAAGEDPRQAVYMECSVCGYQCPDSTRPDWLRAVRTDNFKLIQYTPSDGEPRYELFHLPGDPGERRDVARLYPEELQRLKGLLSVHVLESAHLRAAITGDVDATAAAGPFIDAGPLEILFPAEGQTVAWDLHEGRVPVRWSGPVEAEYLIEYEVGEGKYHLKGSFPVRGDGETFGPFNRIFWRAFPLYNPWMFRVVPRDRPELASPWRRFAFE